MTYQSNIGIVACSSGEPFARSIFEKLESRCLKEYGQHAPDGKVKWIEIKEKHFDDTEVRNAVGQSIRGMDIYVIQDPVNSVTGHSVDTNLAALYNTLDASWRSGAGRVTAVLPYFPYSRQEVARGRECIAAARIIRSLEGEHADRIITLDVHNPAIAGVCTRTLFEDLHASKNHLDYIREHVPLGNLMVCSPDTGAVERNKYFASHLGTGLSMLWKRRDYSGGGEIDEMLLLGDVRGKDVLLVDDMVATAGTLVEGCALLKEKGARDIYFATSLPLFSGPAIGRIDGAFEKGHIKKIIGTDAVHHGGAGFAKDHPWYEEVSVAGYFAKVMWNLNHNRSISELLKE